MKLALFDWRTVYKGSKRNQIPNGTANFNMRIEQKNEANIF